MDEGEVAPADSGRQPAGGIVEHQAGEDGHAEIVVVEKGLEAGGRARGRGSAIAGRRPEPPRPPDPPKYQTPRPAVAADPDQQTQHQHLEQPDRPAGPSCPNRMAVDLMPILRSSSRSTIAYWVS